MSRNHVYMALDDLSRQVHELSESEAQLFERLARATVAHQAERMLRRAAMAYGAEVTAELDRVRKRYHDLIDERRAQVQRQREAA